MVGRPSLKDVANCSRKELDCVAERRVVTEGGGADTMMGGGGAESKLVRRKKRGAASPSRPFALGDWLPLTTPFYFGSSHLGKDELLLY